MMQSIDLTQTYVQLMDGAEARPVAVGADFWETISARTELHAGRLVMLNRCGADWAHWEMHPAGDEIVFLLSGAVDLVLERVDGEDVVELRDRAACIVPSGVWHRAIVHQPGEMLHITRGAGTRHRPV